MATKFKTVFLRLPLGKIELLLSEPGLIPKINSYREVAEFGIKIQNLYFFNTKSASDNCTGNRYNYECIDCLIIQV